MARLRCEVCGKSYAWRYDYLKNHIADKHPEYWRQFAAARDAWYKNELNEAPPDTDWYLDYGAGHKRPLRTP